MTTDALTCGDCERTNAPNRGYCGGCGAVLQPVCRGCRFVNDDGDHYCGGCGNMLAIPSGIVQPVVARASAPIVAVGNDELAELFVHATPAQAELPQNITQGDLDRLFGQPQ
jgi:hypothetical protein